MEKIIKIFNAVFAVLFSWIVILIIYRLLAWSAIVAIVIMAVTVLVGVLFFRCKMQCLNHINYTKAAIFLYATAFVVMVFLALGLEVLPTWDWGKLTISASNYVITGQIDGPEYFARYPNNNFWLSVLIVLFKVTKLFLKQAQYDDFKIVSIIFSCILVWLTLLFTYKVSRLLWDKKKAFIVGFVSCLCLPFYMYAMFAYTDSPGMLIGVLLIYFYLKLKKSENKERIVYSILLGVFAALAFKIKITAVIVFVAIIIGVLLSAPGLKKLLAHGVAALAGLVLTMALSGILVNQFIVIDEQDKEVYAFPPSHWVMMSFNKESGGYVQEDVEYTMGFTSYDEKNKAAIKELSIRIKELGPLGVPHHIFVRKILRTWCDSTLMGDNYVARYPVRNGLLQQIFCAEGKYHTLCLIYTWVYYIFIIGGILLSAILSFYLPKRKQKFLVGRIAIFGIALFLMIWECNARYLLVFLPIMILTAMEGLFLLRGKLKTKREEIKK